jgi:hypothetical protein
MERLIKIAADLLEFCEAQLIENELAPLVAAKESPGILSRLKQMLGSP